MDHPLQKMRDAIKEDYVKVWEEHGSPPSRDFYVIKGTYNKEQINKYFGSFSAFKGYCCHGGQAELARSTKRKMIKREMQQISSKKIHQQIIPFSGKWQTQIHKKSNYKQLMVAFDFHDEYVDPFCLKTFIETCRERRPEYINLGGDVIDFYELSHFSKDPSRIYTLQRQIDFVINNILRPIREACPRSQIDYILGNHEFRLIKFLMTEGQAIASLKCLEFGELLHLEEFKINLIASHPLDRIDDKSLRNYVIYEGMYLVTHGTSTTKNHAEKELATWRMSGCSGHVHHRQKANQTESIVQSTVSVHGEMDWTSCGCMCQKLAGKDYIHDIIKWQNGFNCVHLFPQDGTHINEYIEIKNGIAIIGGSPIVGTKS